MHKVTIHPRWSIERPDGEALAQRLLEVLVEVHEHGSLAGACKHSGMSYRHAWQLIRQGEALFGTPLLAMERGKGSSLTELGEKLVWADRRINARLSPLFMSLASELEAEIEKLCAPAHALMRIHANHGFAVETLRVFLAQAQVPHELKYCGSVEAVAALHGLACEVAGFAVPVGEFEPAAVAHYGRWFAPRSQRVIHVTTREQGLMVAAGNPLKLYEVKHLARPGVRFINRQPGSGTRLLLDLMLRKQGMEPSAIHGYEQCEFTHAAIAAYVASGMADAGFGVETPARRFKLDFIPSQTERYLLLCDERVLETPAVQQMLGILRSAEFRHAVNQLPGYRSEGSGTVMTLPEAFETLRGPAPSRPRR
ncbi:MAG: helix-turn-helix transcriptional regulator [Rhizobacter sp.]|nr:helix-turn-helix transcriptional regulator [Rhizobacter sp.]